MKKLLWCWHIHDTTLLEPLTEPLKNRIEYIKKNKPKDEIPLRLKLLKRVKGKLPKEIIEARQKCYETRQKCIEMRQKYDYFEAWQKCYGARQKYIKAWQKYGEAIQKHLPQLKALHQKECGCGYDFEKNTIFTKENGLEKKTYIKPNSLKS